MNTNEIVEDILKDYTSEQDLKDRITVALKMVEVSNYADGVRHGKEYQMGLTKTVDYALGEANKTIEELTEALEELKRKTMFSGV